MPFWPRMCGGHSSAAYPRRFVSNPRVLILIKYRCQTLSGSSPRWRAGQVNRKSNIIHWLCRGSLSLLHAGFVMRNDCIESIWSQTIDDVDELDQWQTPDRACGTGFKRSPQRTIDKNSLYPSPFISEIAVHTYIPPQLLLALYIISRNSVNIRHGKLYGTNWHCQEE